jgi:lauroyl/myristoyl acyltransferase
VSRSAPPVRWYTHGWNRALSWRLIHGIIPRVPRALRPPIHLATTAVCFLAMPRERRAARANLRRITGRGGAAAAGAAFRLFYNFSKFMVAYTDLEAFAPDRAARRVEGAREAARFLDVLLARGRGLVLATLHLGNWETGLALLASRGRPVHVVLRREEIDADAIAMRLRARPGVRPVAAGESPLDSLDLLLALRRGEIVAVQGDRAWGAASYEVPLFGAPARLPAGPFLLAQAAGAPLALVCVPFLGHRRSRLMVEGPIEVGPGPAGPPAAAAEFAARVETVVGRYPTQWFNFFPVWDRAEGGLPGAGGPASGARRSAVRIRSNTP